jgi:cellulose biosynthesis protein BcsQ
MPTHDNPFIHIVLNGKGGIGKSTLATMHAQWKTRGQELGERTLEAAPL